MKAYIAALLLLGCVGYSIGQNSVVERKNASVYCVRIGATNQLEMTFSLILNGEDQGVVYALNSTGHPITTCTIGYNSTTMIYSFVSLINISTETAASNGCGFMFDSATSIYSWVIKYFQYPAFLSINGGLNSAYSATCNLTDVSLDSRDTAISPSIQNINQNVVVDVPSIVLKIFYETSANSNNFQQVTSSTPSLSSNTRIKLQLELNFGTFDANKISGVTGLLTEASGNLNFAGTLTQIINSTGCAAGQGFGPTSTHGFLGPTSTTASSPYIAMTDPFTLWAYPNSTVLVFRVFYGTCRPATFNADLFCQNPCSNPRSTRRRRNVEEEATEEIAYAYVRVYDPNNTTPTPQDSELEDTKNEAMLYVGVGVAAGAFIILLVVIAFLLVFRNQSRRAGEPSKKIPPEGFVNGAHY